MHRLSQLNGGGTTAMAAGQPCHNACTWAPAGVRRRLQQLRHGRFVALHASPLAAATVARAASSNPMMLALAIGGCVLAVAMSAFLLFAIPTLLVSCANMKVHTLKASLNPEPVHQLLLAGASFSPQACQP